MAYNTPITDLTSNSTFYDWYLKENNEIISKLNLSQVSSVTGGDGILVGLSASSGLVTLSIGGTSGNISRGLTFTGDVSFLGNVIVPNLSYKITGITLGTFGYTFGSVIRLTSTSGYTLAQANNADNAEVVGVLSDLKSSYSIVTLSGKIEGNFTTVSGGTLSPGCVYFLDAATAGFITTSEPNTVGQVSKPVIVGLGETAGMIVQYRGNYLNAAAASSSLTGANKIQFLVSKGSNPQSKGITNGSFISYAYNLVSGSTFFNKVLVDTGRTAIDGWFLSGSKNYIYQLYQPGTEYWNLPNEEDFIVGMIESNESSGANIIYTVLLRGTSSTLPNAIKGSNDARGLWAISGSTYIAATAGATGQLVLVDKNYNSSLYSPKYETGFVFAAKPSNWLVMPRPITSASLTSSFRSTELAETLTNAINYTFNGDFSIWQRSIGKSEAYTSPGTLFFADTWLRRQSGFKTSTSTEQSVQRKQFTITDTNVEGNPKYYIDFKCLEGVTADIGSGLRPTNAVCTLGTIIENIQNLNESNITISFYAKNTLPNYTANVYFARYNGKTLIDKYNVGSIELQTSWTKHTLNYTVPAFSMGTYPDDFIEIGLDFNPVIVRAYDNAISRSTNVTISLASFAVYDGTFASPPHQFEEYSIKLRKAQRYYFTTYTDSQTEAKATMLSSTEPVLNTHNFTYVPNSAFSVFKLPVPMRTTPTISIYSPLTGLTGEMYNYTAYNDLRYTSGTRGYNGVYRSAINGNPTISTSGDTTSVRVNIVAGAVPYDVVNCHIVADASLAYIV